MKTKFLDFLKTVFPSTRSEVFVFLFFLVAYGSLASVIALDYRIIFDDRIPWDAYFSFDNRSIVMTGGGFERHPLSNYFFDQIRELALWFSDGKKDANFRLVLAWCSVLAVSMSVVQVFKYLKNIIKLPILFSLVLILFFGAFSTTILLSFTPETYTYSLFFLILFNYYAALKLRKDEKINAGALTLATAAIGGLTITNAVKVFIPVAFEKNLFSSLKKFFDAVLRCGIAVAVFVLLYLNRINFNYNLIFSKTGEQYEKFSKPKVTPLWDMIYSWFFGGNVLFSKFVMRDYHKDKFEYKALFMEVYNNTVPYLAIALLLILVVWSYVVSFKNKLAQILFISFLVDVAIHCILKFGLHTSYIYGGHFVYIYPLMLGWLFYAYKEKPKMLSCIFSVVLILFIYTLGNNWYRMLEFFQFIDFYYK